MSLDRERQTKTKTWQHESCFLKMDIKRPKSEMLGPKYKVWVGGVKGPKV